APGRRAPRGCAAPSARSARSTDSVLRRAAERIRPQLDRSRDHPIGVSWAHHRNHRHRRGPTSAAGQLPGVLTAGFDDLESGLRIVVADAEVPGTAAALSVAARTVVPSRARLLSRVMDIAV